MPYDADGNFRNPTVEDFLRIAEESEYKSDSYSHAICIMADEVTKLRAYKTEVQHLAEVMAKDEAMWFPDNTATEAYLHRGLRLLTSAVEESQMDEQIFKLKEYLEDQAEETDGKH